MGKSSMIRAIGLMSGTSMDGIDIALIATDGDSRIERLGFASVPYEEPFRDRLRQALADAVALRQRDGRPGCLGDVERDLTERQAQAVTNFLSQQRLSTADIDLIGFHGQTVLHRPEQRLTVQLGDGRLLAAQTGIDVVFDLRADDVGAGGQGAPLAPVYHQAMAAAISGGLNSEVVAILNIGGVANVTFLSSNGKPLAFDTGPGNALIDDWVRAHTGEACDRDGRLAACGRVDELQLSKLMDHVFFDAVPP